MNWNNQPEAKQPQVLFIIRGHRNYEIDEIAQRSTWASAESKSQVFWVHGNESNRGTYCEDRRIIVSLEDSRNNMLKKVLEALRFVTMDAQPDLVVLTTTNTYFYVPKVREILAFMVKKEYDLAGHQEVWSHRDRTVITKGSLLKKGNYFMNGAGMLLRPNAYNALLEISCKDYEGIPDDLAISYHFKEKGIPWLHIPRNNLYTSHLFYPSYSHRIKGLNDKHHTSQRMFLIHNFYTAGHFVSICFAFLKIHWHELKTIPIKRRFFPKQYLRRLVNRDLN
jgi:hypothetical protein